MIRTLKQASALLAGLFVLTGCQKEKDDKVPNLAPETTVSVKDVTMADSTTLISSVRIFWSGSDQDGFVQSYQVSLNGQDWSQAVNRTDSLFRFTFQAATDTSTISFHVRSVDEKGLADPTPAILRLPLRNSVPTAAWDISLVPGGDTILTVITLPFRTSDPDGDETIDSVYIRANGGPWYALPRNTNLVSLVPENPGMSGSQPALVYPNGAAGPLPMRLQGLKVDDKNTFEIFARDLALAESPPAKITNATGTERAFYLKRKTADLLVLASHQGANPDPDPIYAQMLADVYPTYDLVDLSARKGINQPRLYETTMNLLMNMYPKVFWYMDVSRNSGAYRADTTQVLLESVAGLLTRYIEGEDHHLLLSSPLPDNANRLPRNARVFGLIPVDSVSYFPNLRLNTRATILSRRNPPYPDLTGGIAGTLDGVDLLYPSASADSIYSAPVSSSSYRGPRVVGVRARNNVTGDINLVYFSIELHRWSSKYENYKTFFRQVLTEDFR